jgi:hypothetical protein
MMTGRKYDRREGVAEYAATRSCGAGAADEARGILPPTNMGKIIEMILDN